MMFRSPPRPSSPLSSSRLVDQVRHHPGPHPTLPPGTEPPERFRGTLNETTRPPAASCRSQERNFDHFRSEFNHDRPHESLGQEPPASLYHPSLRPYPHRLPELVYPTHFELRLVSRNGGIR